MLYDSTAYKYLIHAFHTEFSSRLKNKKASRKKVAKKKNPHLLHTLIVNSREYWIEEM